jgi:pyruvate/2-oxoglutarate/acetoin dehydrogenase E1 component
MGIPGLKICTAASPAAAYGLAKSMVTDLTRATVAVAHATASQIRDNGPGILFLPVKMMKETKGTLDLDRCMPLNKAAVLHRAREQAVTLGKAVTVLTYLHGVKESQLAIQVLLDQYPDLDVDLIELRSLKPLDLATIR